MPAPANYLDLKRYRKALGADLSAMAEMLGLEPADAPSLGRMENGAEPIPDSVMRVLEAKLVIWRAEQRLGPTPKFVIGTDMAGGSDGRWILHTQRPRFLAAVTDSPIEGMLCANGDGIDWLAVTMWIDEPDGDPQTLLNEAVEQLIFHSMHF